MRALIRYFCSMLATTILLFAALPAATSAALPDTTGNELEIVDIATEENGFIISAALTCSDEMQGDVIAAIYDSTGALCAVEIYDAAECVNINLDDNSKYDTLKLMWWYSTLPMADCVLIELDSIRSTTVPENTFTMLRDNYSFPNVRSSFGYSNDYKVSLERYIEVLGTTYGTTCYNNAPTWSGSCYGFAASAALFFTGDLNYTDYDSTAESVYDIPAPETADSDITALIEAYHISQNASVISKEKKNNTNKMEEIISAVEHFEETGEDPIIVCVRTETVGHALIPYKVETNSDGSYSIYVYDCKRPSDTERIIIINEDMDEFYYNGGSETAVYTYNITYNYVSTVYDFFAADKVSLASVDEDTAAIIINSDNVSITNSDGISIENIAGAYEIILDDEQPKTAQMRYVVPAGEYIIKNYSSDMDVFEVSAANDYDYQAVRTEDLNASIIVGVDSLSGRIYTSIETTETSNNSIELLNNMGVCTVFESEGKHLGVKGGTTNAAVEADSVVLCNGTEVNVGTEDAAASIYAAAEQR